MDFQAAYVSTRPARRGKKNAGPEEELSPELDAFVNAATRGRDRVQRVRRAGHINYIISVVDRTAQNRRYAAGAPLFVDVLCQPP